MTNKYSFVSNLLFRPWAINPEYAQNAGGIIAGILDPRFTITETPEPEGNKPFAVFAVGDSLKYPVGYDKAPKGAVAIIPVKGELMKYDEFCGPAGMQTIGKRIQDADSHKNISSIMLIMDTPGGSVDGVKSLGNIIKNTQKPITAFIDGNCFSAGMWLASNADKIIASTEIDQLGSIGVMTSFVDMQPVWESMGVKFHEVYSSLSPDKNRLFRDMRHGDYESYKKQVLDPLAEEFRNVIKSNRPNATDDQLTGKTYFAKDVVGSLIDEIASLDQAIQITSNLNKQVNINKSEKTMANFKNIEKATGVDAFEVQDGGIFLTEDQANAIESQLETSHAEIDKVNAEVDQLNQKLGDGMQREHELQLETQRLAEVIETLKKQPAEKAAEVVIATNVVKTKDNDVCITDPEASFMENIERVQEYLK